MARNFLCCTGELVRYLIIGHNQEILFNDGWIPSEALRYCTLFNSFGADKSQVIGTAVHKIILDLREISQLKVKGSINIIILTN